EPADGSVGRGVGQAAGARRFRRAAGRGGAAAAAGGRMDRLMVRGGTRLAGRVAASGSKNAVLPCMAAALLTDEPVILRRVPDLRDVRTLAQILERLGVRSERDGDTLTLQCVDRKTSVAP